MGHKRIIDKIRKLLRLASSDNEHEAAAAAAKAQALLSEYNLSMTEVAEQDGQRMGATRAHARTRQRLEPWAFLLARITADAFDCDYFHSLDGYTVFVGVGADQEVCAWTYVYLYKTLLRMGSAYLSGPCKRLRTNKSRSAARESYLKGIVFVLRLRLEEQKQRTPVTESALVPVKRSHIEAAMPDDVRIKKSKEKRLRDNDFSQGMRDGHEIPLSRPLDAEHRAELR
jgi:hypothetical protein